MGKSICHVKRKVLEGVRWTLSGMFSGKCFEAKKRFLKAEERRGMVMVEGVVVLKERSKVGGLKSRLEWH